MKKEYLDIIEKVRLRIKNNEVDNVMNALSWISLLQLAESTDRGRFYNDHFFMLIDYDDAVQQMLYDQDLFPVTVYEDPDFKTNKGYIYLVCYDIPNYIGIPKFAIKAPYFKFTDLSPSGREKAFSKLMDICECYEQDMFGDGIDIV